MKTTFTSLHTRSGNSLYLVPVVVTLLLLTAVLTLVWYVSRTESSMQLGDVPVVNTSTEYETFTSDADFLAYIADNESLANRNLSAVNEVAVSAVALESTDAVMAQDGAKAVDSSADVSSTNVQVRGIDEPDIVKTDGTNIYTRKQQVYTFFDDPIFEDEVSTLRVAPESEIAPVPPVEEVNALSVIQAVPAEAMEEQESDIKNGNLLYGNDTLIVLGDAGVTSYSTADGVPSESLWNLTYEDSYYVDARLTNGALYVVTQQNVYSSMPCPLRTISVSDVRGIAQELTVPCTDILHPSTPVNANSVATVIKLNPQTGEVLAQQSLTTNAWLQTIALFNDGLYIVNDVQQNPLDTMVDVMRSSVGSVFGEDVQRRVNAVMALDISDQSKSIEISLALNEYVDTLSPAEQDQLQENAQTALDAYVNENRRTLSSSLVTKLSPEDLSILATQQVGGRPYGQFALDEYNGYLRMFTTVDVNNYIWQISSSLNEVNDLYILDSNLNVTGQVLDIAPDERVYAARFMQDKAYLVTFKQIDPFFVFDVSNPAAPRVLGELKLPGYSSYLHPIANEPGSVVMMGVGQEDNASKVTLFDASNAEVPTEITSLLIPEAWTDINNTHHAFLQDAENEVVFIPARGTGYIVSYADNALEIVATIEDISAERAVYIDDVLYVVGQNAITAIERGGNWDVIGSIEY